MCVSLTSSMISLKCSPWLTGIGLTLAIIFSGSAQLQAAGVTLSWSPNTEANIAGYKVYQRTLPATDFGSPIFSGPSQTPNSPSLTIADLPEGHTYAFIVTAYDTKGNESRPSEEQQVTLSNTGTNTPDPTNTPTSYPPPLASPAPGSTLTTTTVTFTGGHTSQDYQHWVQVGSTPGGSHFYAGPVNAKHQATVSGLPASGTIYVRYNTRAGSSSKWESQTFSFTMQVKN